MIWSRLPLGSAAGCGRAGGALVVVAALAIVLVIELLVTALLLVTLLFVGTTKAQAIGTSEEVVAEEKPIVCCAE